MQEIPTAPPERSFDFSFISLPEPADTTCMPYSEQFLMTFLFTVTLAQPSPSFTPPVALSLMVFLFTDDFSVLPSTIAQTAFLLKVLPVMLRSEALEARRPLL